MRILLTIFLTVSSLCLAVAEDSIPVYGRRNPTPSQIENYQHVIDSLLGAADAKARALANSPIAKDTVKTVAKEKETKKTALKPVVSKTYRHAHFAWGVSAGASIDCCGQDMSSVDFDASFGLRYRWIQFLGVGAAAKIMVSNTCRSYPLFVEFHTNFRQNSSLFFWALRGGMALNYLEHNHHQVKPYVFNGLGIRLAYSDKFSSHILIGYTFLQRNKVFGPELTHNFTDLHYASFKLGVNF